MPAQNAKNQIPVPIFRMLGSDPIRQYDHGLGKNVQGVISLEPVYKNAGGSSTWVNWYFDQFVEGESMEYAYTQAGQENSFTWDAMSKGYEIQMPLIARLRDEKKIKVETLAESGQWFRKKYKTTPATSVCITKDLEGGNLKTVWFNSRFFRVNLLWENGTLRFRDIHLFNENFPSIYETQKATSNECSFFTLPFVDGYRWSTQKQPAGLRFKEVVDGKEQLMEGGDPKISMISPGKLSISWPLKSFADSLVIIIDERGMKIHIAGMQSIHWFLELAAADGAKLPFKNITPDRISCEFEGMKYSISAAQGSFSKPENGSVFRIYPKLNYLNLNFVTVN
jgi:hypothetical protein